MNKRLFVLLLLIISSYCFAQKSNDVRKDSVPYEMRYKKLKALYIKQIDSESYKKASKLEMDFIDKLNLESTDYAELNDMEFIDWARKNLKKTEFKTIAEAEKEWSVVEAAEAIEMQENAAYHNYLLETLQVTRKFDIMIALEEEVKAEYPEKFPEPEYSNVMPKLPGQ